MPDFAGYLDGRPLLRAKIDAASAGANAIVAAVSNKKIIPVHYFLVAAAAVTVKWQSGTTDLTGAMSINAAGNGFDPGVVTLGHFETARGSALNLNLGSAVQVSGYLTYATD
jgi:hypothetical protein